MEIQWLGEACFKIKTKQKEIVRLITDPFEPVLGLRIFPLNGDIVVLSSKDPRHRYLKIVKGKPFVIEEPGEYELKDIFIQAFPLQDRKEEKNIFLIKMEEISLLHLGIFKNKFSQEQIEVFEGVDILTLPVGGKTVIDAERASEIIREISPKIILPMYYKLPGLKEQLDPLEKFCKISGLCFRKHQGRLKVKKGDLVSKEEAEVILLTVQSPKLK